MLRKINLIEYFESGIKSDTKLKIGTEHEKFILNKSTLKPLSYNEKNGTVYKSIKITASETIEININSSNWK